MSLYDILGIETNATAEQIKKQYRKLSMEFHPDRPNGNAEKFKTINEAYEQLSDSTKRHQYDQSLHPMPDLFDMIFKDQMFSQGFMFQMMKPPPLVVTSSITLDQSYTGCKVPITIERWVHVQHIKQMQKEILYIDIPQGIDSDECMMLSNKGNMGADGLLGDVRIVITVLNNTKLERKGLDLWYTHIITLKESLCGFTFDMEYLQGQKLKIVNSPGNVVSPYFKKVMPDMGMKRDSHKGQLIIAFSIIFPATLPAETIETISTLL